MKHLARLLLATALGAPLAGCPQPASATTTPVAAAPRTAVAARGRLTPACRLRSIAGPAGERVVSVEVEELETVEADQVLAVLESNAERRASRDLAARNVQVAERQLATIVAQGEVRIRLAELSVRQLEAVSPQRVLAMEAEVARREAFVAQHQTDLDRLGPLLARGAAREEEVVRQGHVLRQAVSSLAAGRAELEQLRQQTSTDLALARATVDLRRAELEREREALRLDGLRAELALAEAQLARTVVRAPCAGQVLRLLARQGEMLGERAILTLADTSRMLAIVEVYESDVRHVRAGQRARLTSPALPAELAGRVTRVGRLVARNQVYDLDPAADADVRVVEVEVELEQSDVAAGFVSLQVDVVIDLQGADAAPVTSGS